MKRSSVSRAILEGVRRVAEQDDDEDRKPPAGPEGDDRDEKPKGSERRGGDEEPEDEAPDTGKGFAPDANMIIKDQEPEDDTIAGVSGMPSEPGGIDIERVKTRAEEAGLLPIPEDLDLYDLYRGAKHELEHTPDFNLAVAIAAHHVAKYPKYYEFLDAMEEKMRAEEPKDNEPGEEPEEEPPAVTVRKREPFHSMDVHDEEGEDDGW